MLRFSSAALALILAALTLTACDSEPKDTHPDQLVTKRRAVFKQFTRTLEPMGMVARDRKPYNSSEFMISALELQKLSSQPWPYFTADSNYPPTHAKPEVWQEASKFKAAQDEYLTKVNQLVAAAQSGDLGVVRTAVDTVQKSCKSCHDTYRNDR